MKKHLRILLPLMILVVFAAIGTSSTFADTSTPSVPVKTLTYDTTAKPAYSESLIVGNGGFLVYPVEAKATGKMYIDVKAPSSNSDTIFFAVGKFDGTNLSYYNQGSCSSGVTKTGEGGYDVVSGNTYYVGIKGYSSNHVDQAQVRAYIVPYANNTFAKSRTLQQSKYLVASTVKKASNEKTSLYYKVTPKKTGVMTITLKSFNSSSTYGYITLYSAGKKLRSEKTNPSSSSSTAKVRFGVKKGTTYYLKVQDMNTNYDHCYKYGIKYSITAATNRSISKKSNAKTLKRKATSTATLFTANGLTETDWYKFKVTSKRKTVFSIDATQMERAYPTDQKITITVYKGSKKVSSTSLLPGQSGKFTITYGTTYGKANAGTYYIKVTKTKKISGKYKIRYVQ